MHTWKIGFTVASLLALASASGCGGDADSDENTGGTPSTGGRAAGGTSTGGRATGGTPAQAGTPGEEGGSGGAPAAAGGEGGEDDGPGEGGAACVSIEDYLPPTPSDDPGPACTAYADCMSDSCGELYEDAFGSEWQSGDLSGGACGPSVPCFQGCGCDTVCLTSCLTASIPCAQYALQLQGCYTTCETDALACQEERAP